jgi:hypothetical protein
MAISRLTVAALGRLDAEGRVVEARLVPGSATPQIRRFTAVEEMLLGKIPEGPLIAEAGKAAAAEMRRLAGRRWSSEFKEAGAGGHGGARAQDCAHHRSPARTTEWAPPTSRHPVAGAKDRQRRWIVSERSLRLESQSTSR